MPELFQAVMSILLLLWAAEWVANATLGDGDR